PDATAKPGHATESAAASNAATHAAATAAPTSKPAAAAPVAVAVADSAPPPTTADTAKKKLVPAKRRLSRGKKPVVVDYDKKPDPTPDQDEALSRARAAYAAGNQHLFAGETDAAIVAYRQALADYPNYVAGYRGLGLAFAQQGNKASALDAFKTYVKLAPSAKDVALIEKRIANLSLR
ncbi:MAG TPA: tetratricopeptide repeat protein, partial [Kofleriaceae bacterium]|nr:tetratricopeptide repeat protein [Kofleriaceae bacterium]